MIRIPDAGRFELRLPDGAANPYLLPAAIATAGLEGIAGARDPGSPLDVNMDAEHERPPAAPALPQNLLDALRALETNTTFAHAFGAPFVEAYARQKRREWYAFCGELTAWERRTTLDC
jgi:glutamine synthetase